MERPSRAAARPHDALPGSTAVQLYTSRLDGAGGDDERLRLELHTTLDGHAVCGVQLL